MALHSSGILLYRMRADGPEVLLVHPGGPYFVKKDDGVWSIPKGLSEGEEDGPLAAKREFEEELGVAVPASDFTPLEPVKQKGGKIVHAWAAEGDLDVTDIRSNTFRMEFPPKSGRWIDVPEADRAGWFQLEEAAVKMLSGQQDLLKQLTVLLSHLE